MHTTDSTRPAGCSDFPQARDIEVTAARLEDAFLALTARSDDDHPHPPADDAGCRPPCITRCTAPG